jgi:hypothetical protein
VAAAVGTGTASELIRSSASREVEVRVIENPLRQGGVISL